MCLLLQDGTVAVWDIKSLTAITLRTVLEDQGGVFAVELSETNIISDSGGGAITVQPSFVL